MDGPHAVALDYDALAADYARHRRVHPGVLRALRERAGPTAAAEVIEVGCGTGNYLLALREAVGCRCWGVDPSAEMLAQARARASSTDVAFAPGRAERLPFPDARFDLAYSVDVIHHVADRPAYWREAARLLRPGGRLCTVTDSAEDIRRRRPLSAYFPETVPIELARYPRIDVLRAEMAEAGFAGVRDEATEVAYDLTDAQPYRDRAFSSLHLIPDDALARGLAAMEADLRRGPVPALSLYTLLWGTR